MVADQSLTVEDAYKRSLAHFQKGEFKPAVTLLDKIIKAVPNYAQAHQLIGLTALQLGQMEPAEKAMREAIRLVPNNADFLVNFVEVLRKADKSKEAVEIGWRAVQFAPKLASAHSNLGLAYYDTENLEQAETSQLNALKLDENFVPALNNLGSIARDNKDEATAISYYRRVLEVDGNYLETANNLISVLIETEALDDACVLTEDYLSRAPKSADLNRNRGRLHLLSGELDEAEKMFRTAITLEPDKPDAYVGLSQVLFEKNHPDLALIEAETALRIDPEYAGAYHYTGKCKAQLGDIDAGFANYEKSLELNPGFTGSLIALGHLEMERGAFKAARKLFEEAATYEKAHLSAHIALARLDKITPDDPSFKVLEEAKQGADGMLPDQAVAFHYALGKCYEDLQRHDEAFANFAKGAAIKRRLIKFDPDQTDATTDNIIETFTPAFIKRLRASAVKSDQPIFVVGMPRSGTTLTESILASHPKVFGAGELSYMHSLFTDRQLGGVKKTGSLIAEFSKAELADRVTQYLNKVDRHAPNSPRVVDKMPANFQMVGLIHALMPNAKIIHIARNPFDTCLSCFTRVFERSQYHSYDQVELGTYFNAYVRLMNHWRKVLPNGSFHTVHYEELVDDIDTEARAIIKHCGLKWDDACLEFYKGNRRVRTASVQQVRQPLYATSKEKWRKYEAHLGPLIETIGTHQIEL
jgi:tetratricopeptide (TPR) repeat protein